MNKVLGFLRIPLVKFIGIAAILYFALFSNRHNPDSLRNRLSKERVSKNLEEAKEKSRFIISNLNTAKEIAKEKKYNPNISEKISIEDVEIGSGDLDVSCGSEAEISYGIYSENGSQIKAVSSEKLIIGSNLNEIIERNIYGMRKGGIRNIKIPSNFKTNNINLSELLKFYNSGIRFQVSLISLSTRQNAQITCR
jgi:hypothetical protein